MVLYSEIVPVQLPLRPERNQLQTLFFSPAKQPTLWLASVHNLLHPINLRMEGLEYDRNSTRDLYTGSDIGTRLSTMRR